MARERHKAMLSAAEKNSCRTIVPCLSPEFPQLTYLRHQWDLDILPHVLRDYSRKKQRERKARGGANKEGEGETDEEVDVASLDPTQWKDQDHYALLGLSKVRYRASPQEIRKAYRQKVLVHHPDKKSDDKKDEGDDHFKCIKIAYDILYAPKKRRAYDSVDPTFDDTVPGQSSSNKENFYDAFGPIFRENSRWSVKQPVPQLGDDNTSISEVDTFYAFWYDMESWREFSYLDEENPEKGECREERRWLEKQNKAARQKRKKEELSRLRTLVDNAYACDPRVKRFKEQAKAEREAEKREKAEAAKREAELRRMEEMRRKKEQEERRLKEEEETRAQAAQVKKEKDASKKVLKKERKTLRALCKEYEYFASSESDMVVRLQDLERLCTSLSLDALRQLNKGLEDSKSIEEARPLFDEQVSELNRQEQEKIRESVSEAAATSSGASSDSTSSNWSVEEVQLLVKAVTTFPVGTVKRWETIADFINTHSTGKSREKTAKMVITKVKSLQKLESKPKESLNKQAFDLFQQQHQPKEKGIVKTVEQPQATERYDGPKPWTAEEQKLLEQALRTHPASLRPERWNKITKDVGTRTKEECVARVKELVARVKAKKQAAGSS